MQQLSGLDTGFLTMETATQFGHVGGLYVFEEGASFEATRDQIERRLHLLPPYRRQLVEVTFGLDNPYWIESPNFDLDFHVREIAVRLPEPVSSWPTWSPGWRPGPWTEGAPCGSGT